MGIDGLEESMRRYLVENKGRSWEKGNEKDTKLHSEYPIKVTLHSIRFQGTNYFHLSLLFSVTAIFRYCHLPIYKQKGKGFGTV